jgi:hypothetical protein
MFFPGSFFSRVSCSVTLPLSRVEPAHSVVAFSVVETTNLGLLMCAATGSSVPVLPAQKGTNR